MFNLFDDTHHESGIIVYPDNSVAVLCWPQVDDNLLPHFEPSGLVVWLPVSEDIEISEPECIKDIRDALPDTLWVDESGALASDMEILADEFGDLPALFGFRISDDADPANYDEFGYSGVVYEVDGIKIVTCDFWN